jgi:chemotaxis family two-component system response regulator Rcp1
VILLVEDNPADVKILQRALAQSGGGVELVVARDGSAALTYLQDSRSPDLPAERRPPDLVLLDFNLPGLTGYEVLQQLRSAPQLSLLPVIVLSTSSRPQDVTQAYAAGANAYVEKPQEFDRLVELLRQIQRFWLETALLPTPGLD